jgi:hypothetical protein
MALHAARFDTTDRTLWLYNMHALTLQTARYGSIICTPWSYPIRINALFINSLELLNSLTLYRLTYNTNNRRKLLLLKNFQNNGGD